MLYFRTLSLYTKINGVKLSEEEGVVTAKFCDGLNKMDLHIATIPTLILWHCFISLNSFINDHFVLIISVNFYLHFRLRFPGSAGSNKQNLTGFLAKALLFRECFRFLLSKMPFPAILSHSENLTDFRKIVETGLIPAWFRHRDSSWVLA